MNPTHNRATYCTRLTRTALTLAHAKSDRQKFKTPIGTLQLKIRWAHVK